jgi:hypothetical protein
MRLVATTVTAALVLTAALANADEGTSTNPDTAEFQDKDLSQIHGVPVPVGDHNQYYYAVRPWNISANPIGWVLGLYGISGSYAVNNHMAVRLDLDYYQPVDSDLHGMEFGVGLPLYFRQTYQGLFLEPGIAVRQMSSGSYDETVFGPQVLVGWHWSWDGGWNAAVAVGVGRNISSKDDDYDNNKIFPNGYMRFGYSF